LADPGSPSLRVVTGHRVVQRPFHGFLRGRRWDVPYLGRWFYLPEGTRAFTGIGPVAVIEMELAPEAVENREIIMLGDLRFRSILDADLDARKLPPPMVSEAARDVLGAVAAARVA
jgi:hypothetical protein